MVQRVIHLQKNDVGRMSRFISHLNEVHNPVFFHDVNGNTYCIIHGRKEGRFTGGYTANDIYRLALCFTNMDFGQPLYVLSCHSAYNNSKCPFVEFLVRTPYRILSTMIEDHLVLGFCENEEEAKTNIMII